jgi:hypothetical protein
MLLVYLQLIAINCDENFPVANDENLIKRLFVEE